MIIEIQKRFNCSYQRANKIYDFVNEKLTEGKRGQNELQVTKSEHTEGSLANGAVAEELKPILLGAKVETHGEISPYVDNEYPHEFTVEDVCDSEDGIRVRGGRSVWFMLSSKQIKSIKLAIASW